MFNRASFEMAALRPPQDEEVFVLTQSPHLERRAERGVSKDAPRRRGNYRASVQLSEKASADVLKGRPSRCNGQGLPPAMVSLRVRRAPKAGISKVQTPYLRPVSPGLVWISNGSAASRQ